MEAWLTGPVTNIPGLLQPVAHSLMQSAKEVKAIMANFPQEKLLIKPAGMASVQFHLLHLKGVLQRMLAYADDRQLSDNEFNFLQNETSEELLTVGDLLEDIINQVELVLNYLKFTDHKTLTEERFVGRKKLPSTKIGILFHAAEHTQRHIGQLLVTAAIVKTSF